MISSDCFINQQSGSFRDDILLQNSLKGLYHKPAGTLLFEVKVCLLVILKVVRSVQIEEGVLFTGKLAPGTLVVFLGLRII